MTRLVLIKHSLPEIVRSRPARDWILSNEGISRCVWLAEELARLGVSVLYSSTETRARQTAEITARRLGLVCTTLEDLRENDRTGLPYIDDSDAWQQRFAEFFARPARRVIGNESADEACERFARALQSIVEDHSHERVGVVAHGTVISLFTARHNRVSPFTVWQSLNPLPAYLSVGVPGYAIHTAPRGYPESEPPGGPSP